ncbi:hypothetical protein CAPTEDRAFT_166395 [Capitella teleta]|uniref:Major facilitator superfamily (MFS) profile domain-containing protein n=1 Tax=Capitella teleta TaxID=283909 RepID=R7TWD4_CAPTE|nr:hypothetical protein CAPTEDRAFT_166395 [Capitella teleta]|eukprot:ELT98228.1 hypothetical protein CAPTEDRAFT_166395 [Capitella teleta]
MAGRLIGAVTCGMVSDRFGRRITALLYHGIKVVGAMIACFVPFYESFVFGRFLLAVGSTGSNLATYVLLSEIVGKKYRGIYGVSWNIMFSFGSCAIPGIAFWIRDYLKLQHAFAWPNLVMVTYFFCLDESPRWLAAQGRDDEAIAILQKIAQVNRKPVLSDDVHFNEEREKVSQMKSAQNGTILDLFKTPNMRRKMLILSLTWFTGSMLFYGLSLNSGRLPGDVFVNTFLLSLVEAIGNVCCMFLIDRLGRRRTVGGFMLIGGVLTLGCIPFLIIDDLEIGATVLSVMGKGFVTVSFTGVYILTSEIVPTSVRNIGVGFTSMCARIAGMAAPYVGGPLGDVEVYLPSLIFCVLAFVSGSLVFLLPETLGQNLPDTILESEEFGKKKATIAPVEKYIEEGNGSDAPPGTVMPRNTPDAVQLSEELGNGNANHFAQEMVEGGNGRLNTEVNQNTPGTSPELEDLGKANVAEKHHNFQKEEVSREEDQFSTDL